MIKFLTIIGARPQIIKAAALSRVIKDKFPGKVREIIVHTGQHYDDNMSQIFFDELDIPHPNYNLNAGSGSHGKQTAVMIEGIEEILLKEKPKCIILYGDTNSTLAGAVAASKLQVPIVHIEAGLRSFNRSMPEEINRIICDRVSTLLFSPTKAGFDNLVKEGFKKKNAGPYTTDNPKIYHCGDVMLDNAQFFSSLALQKSTFLKDHGLEEGRYVLATVHRNNNTDDPERLNALFRAINKISLEHKLKIVLPLHPRTAKLLLKNLSPDVYSTVKTNELIRIVSPVSYLEMISLEKNAYLIMTDSGGVQKEAFFFKKPCIILRSETEWVELVNSGSAFLTDANEEAIVKAFAKIKKTKRFKFPELFGDGNAAQFICGEILKNID